MPVLVFAASKPACNNQAWERLQKRVDERRSVLESARSINVKRLQQDIEKIAQREVEFTKKIVQEMIPVKITWNEEAVEKLKAFVPFQVEVIAKESVQDATPAPEKKDETA